MEHTDLLSVVINWFPMLLLIGVWVYFLRRMQGGKKYMTQYQRECMALTERQVVALEQIAKALEMQKP